MLAIFCLLASAYAGVSQMSRFEDNPFYPLGDVDYNPLPLPVDYPTNSDPLFIFRESHGQVDGVSGADAAKNNRILRHLPAFQDEKQFKDTDKLDFLKPQPGVAPKMTGSFTKEEKEEEKKPASAPSSSEAATNPAATFLHGADFDSVEPPKCRMLGCAGPFPNDGSIDLTMPEAGACQQVMVPLNSCVGGKGYPMGMMCSICCECSNTFQREMKKTFGYRHGVRF